LCLVLTVTLGHPAATPPLLLQVSSIDPGQHKADFLLQLAANDFNQVGVCVGQCLGQWVVAARRQSSSRRCDSAAGADKRPAVRAPPAPCLNPQPAPSRRPPQVRARVAAMARPDLAAALGADQLSLAKGLDRVAAQNLVTIGLLRKGLGEGGALLPATLEVSQHCPYFPVLALQKGKKGEGK
jgi:hypothetical protein